MEEDEIELLKLIHDEMNNEYDTFFVLDSYLYGEDSAFTLKGVMQDLLPLCKLLNRLFFEYAETNTTDS